MSEFWTAVILGIVEGITEYLPVSSTGHLILATELLGFDQKAWEVFNIAIQPGAILAIVVLYWRTFWDVTKGFFALDAGALAFIRNLLVAFFPAVLLGLAFGDTIELMLGNAELVAWSLIIGGFAILVVEKYAKPVEAGGVAAVSFKTSVAIGLVQCLAMIPGVSRSGATILGAMTLFARPLLGLFLPGAEEAVEIAIYINHMIGWTFVVMGVSMVVTFLVRANGAVWWPLIILIIAAVVVRFSIGFGLYERMGADAIWWAFIATSLTSMVLSLLYYRFGKWRELSPIRRGQP